jgi:diguanylate cyclase (GGDEF)-like protein
MIEAVASIAATHDIGLLLLAGLMCAAGALSVMRLFRRAGAERGLAAVGWTLVSAVTLGAAVWCALFIALLAQPPGAVASFDPVLTIVSLVVAILGAVPGLLLASSGMAAPRDDAEEGGGIRWRAVAGGAVVGAAIAAVHFVGLAAARTEGIAGWNASGVALAAAVAMVAAAAAFLLATAAPAQARPPRSAVSLLLLAVLSLHATGMAALPAAPPMPAGAAMPAEAGLAMALAIGLAALVVMTAGGFAVLLDRRSQEEARRGPSPAATTDPATGLPNRAAFQERLARGLAQAGAAGARAAVIAIGLDRIGEVNDTHGQGAADAALRAIGQRLAAAAGAQACLARVGSGAFAALVPFRTRAGLDAVLARLEAAAAAPVPIADAASGRALALGARFGIACFPEDGATAEELAGNADRALRRARAQPLAAPCFHDPSMDAAARERRGLASALREAVETGAGLALHYQLQASIRTSEITGYEALLRWRHPTRGMIPPAVFVPLAEETGLIPELGALALRRASAEAAAWPHPWRVAVNISPLQLADASLPALVAEVLAETGLAPGRLEIELTETAIVEDQERALAILRAVKALGVGVALDDFGTGYASLRTLRSFPFDRIKLDRFFMAELETSAEARAVVRSVLALARSLAIPVLAVGVERPEQLAILVEEGCDEAQGFLLGRPSPEVAAGPRRQPAEAEAVSRAA